MWSSREWNGRVSESNQSLGSPQVPHGVDTGAEEVRRQIAREEESVIHDPIPVPDELTCTDRARFADRDVDFHVRLSLSVVESRRAANRAVKGHGIAFRWLPIIPVSEQLDGMSPRELDTVEKREQIAASMLGRCRDEIGPRGEEFSIAHELLSKFPAARRGSALSEQALQNC
jgi:hypothetical protein